MFQKVNIFAISLLLILLMIGCYKPEKKKSKLEEKINYLAVTLRINAPLSFDELEQNYEFPLSQEIEDTIGEIVGDGMPLDEDGKPYATDIEFDIKKLELEHFIQLLEKYSFPKGSYLEVNGKIEYEF